MKPRGNVLHPELNRAGTPKPNRALIYCRVSTKEQALTLSLPTQKEACEEYCQRSDLAVEKVFIEKGESAKTADRTEFKKLLTYCRQNKGRIQYVVVYSVNRFARNNEDHVVTKAVLRGLGITLRSVTEPIDDTSMGKFMETMLAGVAQLDNDVRSERTTVGMKAALADGRWMFSPPLGYRNVLDANNRKNIAPDPERAPLMRKAFELTATGLHTKTEVLRIVNDLGLRTTRKGANVTMQTFQQTLRNPIYAGWLTVKRWGVEPRRGNFEPIVSDEVFDRVQAVLDGKALSVTPHVRSHPDFPLRHFVKCGECRTPLTASWSKGRTNRYAYYRCRTSSCRAVNVAKAEFENEFVGYLGGLKPKPELMRLFKEIVLDVWRQKRANTGETIKALERKLTDLRQRNDTLVDAFVYRRAIDEETYQDQKDKLAEETALAQMELHDARLDELDVEGVLAFAEHVMLNAPRLGSPARWRF